MQGGEVFSAPGLRGDGGGESVWVQIRVEVEDGPVGAPETAKLDGELLGGVVFQAAVAENVAEKNM